MSPDIYQSNQVTLFSLLTLFLLFFIKYHWVFAPQKYWFRLTSYILYIKCAHSEHSVNWMFENVRFYVNDTSRPHEAAVDLQRPCSLWDKIIGFLSELWSEWLRTVSLCIKQENKTAQKNWASLKPKTISSFVQRVQNADSQWNEHKHKHTHTI